MPGRRRQGRVAEYQRQWFRRWGMSAVTPQAEAAMAVAAEPGAGAAIAITAPFGGPAAPAAAGNAAGTSLAAITQQLLQSQTSVSGTLGYAGTYNIACPAVRTIPS